MITGLVSQLHLYKSIHPNLARAIDHVLQLDFENLVAGKYEIAEEDFYMVNEYSTKPAAECEPERHNKFTDIQIMLDGAEKFGYTPFINQQPSTDFSPDNDVAFYTIPQEEIDFITLNPGKFIIFFPTDIHQPEVYVTAPAAVKKLVVKINMT
ncbi:MAG: YhcH/YjgK/YiaL family protein [Bacteroidota bacterium]